MYRRRAPSFSSSLLDAIYRSIDDSNNGSCEELSFSREKPGFKKQRNYTAVKHGGGSFDQEFKVSRAIMIDNWMEKHLNNSSSSSSDSSSNGGLFSSSEPESSSFKEKSRRSKPMKCMQFEERNKENNHPQQAPKREAGGFTKTKLKAMKIYGELKKVKQPISPGGRISNFLNSIFSGNAKKVNVCTVKAMEDVNFDRKSKSTSSSASRSCLNKTAPSTRGKYSSSNSGIKRSVRFYPVSVIVDEDCRPCGHKCIYEDDISLTPPLNVHQQILKNCSLQKDLKKQKKKKKGVSEFVSGGFMDEDEDEDKDDEDALSCSSSDLFELDGLIGIGRYREELPVYETTNLKTNQAIANGFIF